MTQQFKVEWEDSRREPAVPFNRAYPWGIDLPFPGVAITCRAELPWPAPRCGLFIVRCTVCGACVAATTAGRVDDPRSMLLPCRAMGGRQ